MARHALKSHKQGADDGEGIGPWPNETKRIEGKKKRNEKEGINYFMLGLMLF